MTRTGYALGVLARLALSWALNAVVLALVAWLLGGVTFSGSGWSLVIAAAVFGVLNTLLKPILKLLTFPLAIFTLGLAWFGVAMFMLWLTDVLVPKFDISGFWTLVWATIIVWAANLILDLVLDRSSRGHGHGKAAPAS
jgi:putative membrane protein